MVELKLQGLCSFIACNTCLCMSKYLCTRMLISTCTRLWEKAKQIYKVLTKPAACGIDGSAQQTLHLLHQSFSPLAAGWSHVIMTANEVLGTSQATSKSEWWKALLQDFPVLSGFSCLSWSSPATGPQRPSACVRAWPGRAKLPATTLRVIVVWVTDTRSLC